MADQVNGKADSSENENEAASQTPASRPGDPGQDSGANDETKAKAMEDVQEDAAKEREENRGYQ